MIQKILLVLYIVLFFYLQEYSACKSFNITNENGDITGEMSMSCIKSNLSALPNDKSCVQFVTIEGNNINYVELVTFTCLKRLFLDNNQIHTISSTAFNDLEELTILSLANNDISQMSNILFKNVYKLRELYMDGNPLSQINYRTFAGNIASTIEILSLSNCLLDKFENFMFSDFKNLEILNISHNYLKSIAYLATVDRLPPSLHLKVLDVSYNKVTNLNPKTFMCFPSINQLYLSYNEITSLNGDIFYGSEKTLHTIHLRHNNLSAMNRGTFYNHSKLSFIDLSHNDLSVLHKESFFWTNNIKVLLYNNPWQCTCDIAWLKNEHHIKYTQNNFAVK